MIPHTAETGKALLAVRDLVKHFPVSGGGVFRRPGKKVVRAVDGVSFDILKGETLGLVGESGCGKSTVARVILRLQPATAGAVRFEDKSVLELPRPQLRRLRSQMQIIFQDPYASLNPRMTVGGIIGEALTLHHGLRGARARARIIELLAVVGLSEEHAARHPHEFSGGQRQRIGVARALAVEPKLIFCDEPVSALDVSVQAQVLNLLQELKRNFGLTFLFISHDLAVIQHVSDRVAVMYLGKLFEMADREEIYGNPLHPYTRALMRAIPIPDPHAGYAFDTLKGDLPSPHDIPSGCRLFGRCDQAISICRLREPELRDVGNRHYVACHRFD